MNGLELIRLQVAMAFGQGAGTMLASVESLNFLVTEHGALLERAARNWNAYRYAFLELMRVLGQVAATKAAVGGSWQIELQHLRDAIPVVLGPCPCRDADTV